MGKYYSQYRQDQFIDWVIFYRKRKGVFVDIGAHDGISFSNTYFFEKNRAWEGYCFEPNPTVFKKLQENRTSQNINWCVGSENGKVEFWKIEGPAEMLSGIKTHYDYRHIERIRKEIEISGGIIQEIEVRVISLMEFPEILKSGIDYLSIDTEGNELSILESIDFSKLKIKAISIENNYADDTIEDYLQGKGFEKVIKLKCDSIFICKSCLGNSIHFRIMMWKLVFRVYNSFAIRKKKLVSNFFYSF